MQVQEGKFYRTRGGLRVGPMTAHNYGRWISHYFEQSHLRFGVWEINGALSNTPLPTELDLVENFTIAERTDQCRHESCGQGASGMTDTTSLRRGAMEALEGTTEGAWGASLGKLIRINVCVGSVPVCLAGIHRFGKHGGFACDGSPEANARFIAASRTLVPQLLAAIEAAEVDKRFVIEERDRTFALMLARAEGAEADLARVTAERDAARAGEDELAGALIWCSGSEDFSDGGKAVIGWLKLARPAIEAYLASRPNHGKGCVHTEPCECGEPK